MNNDDLRVKLVEHIRNRRHLLENQVAMITHVGERMKWARLNELMQLELAVGVNADENMPASSPATARDN